MTLYNYNFLIDVTGSVRKIFREGKLVCEYNYDAFGKCEVKTYDDNGVNDSNHIGHINPFRWKSYYYDVETSLYYINGRYYDSELGQFINADDACINPLAVNGLNSYSLESMFGISNHLQAPLNSSGTALPVLIGAGIGAVSGFGTSICMQLITSGSVDWGDVFIDTMAGAALGAFGGSTVGRLGMGIAGGAIGMGTSIGNDLYAGRDINIGAALLSGALGAGLGFLGEPGAHNNLIL